MKILKKALMEPLVIKFYSFLILQGLVMPQFSEFDYYFAIDILKISKSTISLQILYVGIIIILLPLVYQRYFNKSEYYNFFLIS